MKIEEWKKRLKALEARLSGDTVYVLVKTPEDEEKEMTVEEWYQNRRTMKFLKFTRGFDPTFSDVGLLLKAIDEAASEAADEHERQTAEG